MVNADGPGTQAIWSGPIRTGRLDELDRLAELEIDAARALIEAGAIPPEDLSATPRPIMEQCVADGLLFVAADEDDAPLGFVAAAERDGALHIGEIDVWRHRQGRGIGRALMLAAVAEARRRGLAAAMLTTDRHAPFNRPFYGSLGFCEAGGASLPPALAAVLRSEIERGLDPARRVGMVLPLDGGCSATALEPKRKLARSTGRLRKAFPTSTRDGFMTSTKSATGWKRNICARRKNAETRERINCPAVRSID
ncbi:GNAT family N-acetyltransferase [Pseudochelatococcus sp. B33]